MKVRYSLFLLMALFVGNAFADGAVASRAISTGASNLSGGTDTVARTTSRTTVSRATPNTNNTAKETTRTTTARGGATTTRVVTNNASRSTTTRTSTNNTTRTVAASRAGGAGVSTVSRAATGDINSNPTVRRAGVVLRPSFADYGGRATISGTGSQTGSNIKSDIQKITGRATKAKQATKESIQEAKEKLESTAELNKTCQEQYNECMDQFCAVIDSNQKRCSCSGNLSKYTKVEKAVTEANKRLNEVAQAIRYVGLSADEIRAIMTETEAEEALDDTKDTSTTRNMLKQIESMIKDPTSSTTTYSSDTGFGLDMDLSFSSEPLDIFNLDIWNLGSNTSASISNLRGTELYNTAKKRCNTILTQCKDAGATQTQITGNYDLAIDKDCLAYESGLKKMNETLLSNVNSANLMLQKARLAVLQNKNQYDAKGCVGALENCMQDDMVCGDDYFNCVDPTKAYIDENGKVVLGQDITVIQSFMTNYNNAAIDSRFLQEANGVTIGKNTCTDDGKCVVKYLLQKIGLQNKATEGGLCRPVLDKCQYYTYKDNKYQPYNDIIVNYIQRAMVNIKAAQQNIISDYASTCIADVAECYNQQITQVNAWSSSAGAANVYGVMRGACRSVALTCGLAIFTGDPKISPNTVLNVDGKDYSVSNCAGAANYSYGSANYNNEIINCISNMFYQSLLCPENSTYKAGSTSSPSPDETSQGWVNTKCVCNPGYKVSSGKCVSDGSTPTTYNVTYNCGTGSTGAILGGVCTAGTIVYPDNVSGCGTKNGATPTGWNIESAECNRNITFTAQWSSNGGGSGGNGGDGGNGGNGDSGGGDNGGGSGGGDDTGGDNPDVPVKTYTVIYFCGDNASGTTPATETLDEFASTIVKDNVGCARQGCTFNRWSCGAVGATLTMTKNYQCVADWTCAPATDDTFTGDVYGSGPYQLRETHDDLCVLYYNGESLRVTECNESIVDALNNTDSGQ